MIAGSQQPYGSPVSHFRNVLRTYLPAAPATVVGPAAPLVEAPPTVVGLKRPQHRSIVAGVGEPLLGGGEQGGADPGPPRVRRHVEQPTSPRQDRRAPRG